MSREVKVFSLTTVDGVKSDVSDVPIRGTLETVQWDSGTWANGSLFISTSGADFNNRSVLTATGISGTSPSARQVFVPGYDVSNSAISGTNFSVFEKPVLFDHLQVAVSGCGSATAGTTGKVRLVYNEEG